MHERSRTRGLRAGFVQSLIGLVCCDLHRLQGVVSVEVVPSIIFSWSAYSRGGSSLRNLCVMYRSLLKYYFAGAL